MKLKQENDTVSASLLAEPLFSPQLSRIWAPTQNSPTWLAGSGDNQWLVPATPQPELPDHLAKGILIGAKQCGLKTDGQQASKGDAACSWEEAEDVVDKGSSNQEDVVDSDYKFGPSILWLDQMSTYEENNCTVEIGRGYLDGVLTHEFLMQRHGQVMNCACGHNVDALKVAKQGVSLVKDLQALFICSPSTVLMHRHCIRVLTPCTELSLYELMTSRRNLREGLEEHARFLCANLVEGIIFLHARNTLHRDVAPLNIFIDNRGYAKLANFHHAVCGAPGQYFKGYCGTLGYQAPEVVACLGHMHTLDYWGIGAVVYHFLYGFSPFADEDMGRLRSKTVLNPEFAITRLGNRFRHLSHPAQEAIRNMLCKYPHKRLGYRYQEANKIKWFHSYHWPSMCRQQMASPLVIFLQEEREITNSMSFHTPATRSMSNPEMQQRSWEMQPPYPISATSLHQTSPSSSASNCSQAEDNHAIQYHKMFGQVQEEKQGFTQGTEEATVEKYINEKSEKEMLNLNFEAKAEMLNQQHSADLKMTKTAENFEKQCKLNREAGMTDFQGNYIPYSSEETTETKAVFPDPNCPPFVPSHQFSEQHLESIAENYMNAHIYAAQLLQQGNAGIEWNASPGYISGTEGLVYTPQLVAKPSMWSLAEGDGQQALSKASLLNDPRNWWKMPPQKQGVHKPASDSTKRAIGVNSVKCQTDSPLHTRSQHSFQTNGQTALQQSFQNNYQPSSKFEKNMLNSGMGGFLTDSQSASVQNDFQNGMNHEFNVLQDFQDEAFNENEQLQSFQGNANVPDDISSIMPRWKATRYSNLAPRLAARLNLEQK